MNRTVRIAFVYTLGFGSINVIAEPQITEQIIITGARTEQLQLDIPAAISVISREEIKQSGAITIADVLRSRAGLQIRDSIGDGGRGVTISMRGFGENATNNTLVMVDGRRLNNPTLRGPDLNSIALKDIERIEILQGGGGVLFGDQAVGGVINVITRSPDKARLDIEAGGGSYDGQRYALTASQRFESGIGARLSAEKREGDNYRDNNASEYAHVLGLLEYAWEGGRVFAETQYVDDKLEFPGSLSASDARQDRRQTHSPSDYGNQETLTRRLGGRLALGENWAAELELTDRDMDGEGFLWASNSTDMRVKSANPRLVGEYQTANGKTLITLGYDTTRSDYLFDIPDYFYTTDSKQQQNDYYAQLVYPLTPTIRVSAGARHSEVDDKNRGNGRNNGDDETVSSISLSWQFRDDMRLLVRRDEVLRYATVDENGATEPGVDFLKPQTGVSLESGVEWYAERLSGRAMLFDMDMDNEILYDPTADGPWGPFGANINLDSSTRRGLLTEWHWQATTQLTLGGSYTYTDAEIAAGSFDGEEVPYVSTHTGALNATWAFAPGLSAFVELVYNGSRYAMGDDANTYGHEDAYSLVNMALRWEQGHWWSSLRANNLADEKYDTLALNYGGYRSVYPAPERALFLSIGYSL